MDQNALDMLKPAGGDHAIEEVVFELNLAANSRLNSPADYKEILFDDLKDELPKFDITRSVFVDVGPEDAKEHRLEDSGFTFESYKNNGKLEYRFHGHNGPPGQGGWLAVNLLSYSRWKAMKRKALAWLLKVLDVQGDLKLAGVTLNYIDRFYWDGSGVLFADDVFKFEESVYLPTHFKRDSLAWSNQLSYSAKQSDYTLIENVSVVIQKDSVREATVATATMPLRVIFDQVRDLRDLASSGALEELFDELHDKNKEVLKSILKNEVQDRIKLNKGDDDD